MTRIDHLILCARAAQDLRDAPPGHAEELQRRLRYAISARLSNDVPGWPGRRLMPDGSTIPVQPQGRCAALAAWVALVQSSHRWGITPQPIDQATTENK